MDDEIKTNTLQGVMDDDGLRSVLAGILIIVRNLSARLDEIQGNRDLSWETRQSTEWIDVLSKPRKSSTNGR